MDKKKEQALERKNYIKQEFSLLGKKKALLTFFVPEQGGAAREDEKETRYTSREGKGADI
jgi:hypothetical protein